MVMDFSEVGRFIRLAVGAQGTKRMPKLSPQRHWVGRRCLARSSLRLIRLAQAM